MRWTEYDPTADRADGAYQPDIKPSVQFDTPDDPKSETGVKDEIDRLIEDKEVTEEGEDE